MAPGTCIAASQACPATLLPYAGGCPSRRPWLIIFCVLLYLAAFSPGLGPVPWAMNAEIFPTEARSVTVI